jgi:hypothetical protein
MERNVSALTERLQIYQSIIKEQPEAPGRCSHLPAKQNRVSINKAAE